MLSLRLLFFVAGGALASFYPFLSALLASRGFGPAEIGAATGLTSLAYAIAAPTWGHLGDVVLGRTKALRLASVGATVVLLGLLVPDLAKPATVAILVGFFLFEAALGPLSDALAVNALGDRRREYPRIRLLMSVSFAVAVIGFGFLYDRTGFGLVPIAFGVAETRTVRIEDGLLRAEGEAGACRVICFDPRHDLTLARMPASAVRRVVDVWAEQTSELGASYPWVQVFENRGQAMGASNPHPHGQIWAGTAVPREAAKELANQRRHAEATRRRLLLDYADQEADGPRVVEANDDWLVVVPFWAAWPYETLLISRRPAARLPDLAPSQRDSLAGILIRLLARYDNLFGIPFPYSMGWHQAPFITDDTHWQLHAHFLPPLLRASVRKFMVGYELLAETQRDLTAEQAAEDLRAASPVAKATIRRTPSKAASPV